MAAHLIVSPLSNAQEKRMIEVTGIDHIYIAVSDLAVSERFSDLVLVHALGFRKNAFALGDEPHIQ
jgi:glyoxylase I family protein